MKKALMHFTIIFSAFLLSPCLIAAQTFSGTVRDSLTSQPLPGVTVQITALSRSTSTDALGKYSLVLPTTEIISSAPQKAAMKIFYNHSKNAFFWNGEKVFVEICNVKGGIAEGDNLSPGQYFAIWRNSKISGAFKFLNIARQSQSFVIESENRVVANELAKAAAVFVLGFTAENYRPASRSVSGGGSVNNLDQKLLPEVIPLDSAKINLNIGLDTLGRTDINVIILDD